MMLESLIPMNKNKCMDENETLHKLILCIILFGVIALIVGMVIWAIGIISLTQCGFYILGLVLGIIAAVLWARDIYSSVSKGIDLGANEASKYMRRRSIIRMIVIIAIIITGGYLSLNMIVGTMVGLISLKISAYMQILINKLNK